MRDPATVVPVDCRVCDGFGVLYRTVVQIDGEEYEIQEDCPACGGNGWTVELIASVLATGGNWRLSIDETGSRLDTTD
jgi:DnaJ-class molecular chaperone